MTGVRQSERHMTNEELYSKTGQIPISKEICIRQLKFTGHCIRMNNDEPANIYVLYMSKIKSSGRKGRPKRTYSEQIAKHIFDDIQEIDKDQLNAEIIRYAEDKPKWKALIGGQIQQSRSSITSVMNAPDELAR